MRIPLVTLFAGAILGVASATMSIPALAQVQDRVVTVYGNDPCPSSNGQEIVVCRRAPRNDQYCIPRDLRDSEAAPQALGGTAVAAVNTTGGTGVQVQSCNAVGAGVNAGCFKKEADAWRAQKRAEKREADSIP